MDAGDVDAATTDGATTDAPAVVPRRIVLTIPAGKVTQELTDFPVYVDLTDPDLKTRLDPGATQLSFRLRIDAGVETLPHEVQSFDRAAGRLRAWVLLPTVASGAATVFELQYGATSVMVPANPAQVWRNGFQRVFHLESATTPIVESHQGASGTPMNLSADDAMNAKVGKGVNFSGANNEGISFTNPLSGNMSSTISAWVLVRDIDNSDPMVVVGNAQNNQARLLYASRIGTANDRAVVGLYTDDWDTTNELLPENTWRLLHWTYEAGGRRSRLYVDGVDIGGSFGHANDANTQGATGRLGSAPAGFIAAGLNGLLDEVRICNVERTPAWMKAEFDNQSTPTTFVIAAAPDALP